MIKKILISLVAVASFASLQVNADTLSDVKARGNLKCGVNTGLAGFAAPDGQGVWKGIDVDVCRAVAAAIFGDGNKVEFIPLSAQQRFTAIQSGEVDVLSRNTTYTFQREASLGLLFAHVVYYDGQGFIVKKSSGIKNGRGLNNKSVCVQPGTTTELNLADFARNNKINIKPVVIERFEDSVSAYMAGRCDAYTTDASGLAAIRATSQKPTDHLILPDIISKEPLAPAVRQGDDKWYAIVNWTVIALVNAEELGVTKANLAQQAKSSQQDVKRLLNSDIASSIGLPADFAQKALAAVGNYGEIFDRNVGAGSALKLERGLNALWTNGGLQYGPPIR
jgi:general L-amino acid transport system substrate-binding protein